MWDDNCLYCYTWKLIVDFLLHTYHIVEVIQPFQRFYTRSARPQGPAGRQAGRRQKCKNANLFASTGMPGASPKWHSNRACKAPYEPKTSKAVCDPQSMTTSIFSPFLPKSDRQIRLFAMTRKRNRNRVSQNMITQSLRLGLAPS